MFGARLHPYKPSPQQRVVLERLGLALRPWNTSERLPAAVAEPLEALRTRRLTALGCPTADGGLGDDAMLLTLAAERAGREGGTLGSALSKHMAGLACALRWAEGTVRQRLVHAAAQAHEFFTVPVSWRLDPVRVVAGVESAGQGRLSGLLKLGPVPVPCHVVLATAESGTPHARLWHARLEAEPDRPYADVAVDMLTGAAPLNQGLGDEAADLAAADLFLHLMLMMAAVAVGVASDAFQRVQEAGLTKKATATTPEPLARAGALLEALRSLVYASAEAVRFWSERPGHGVLAEVEPLVAEAVRFAANALPDLLDQLILVARQEGKVPERLLQHRTEVDQWAVIVAEPRELDRIIARFYA